MKKENTCDPALNVLNEEITSDIPVTNTLDLWTDSAGVTPLLARWTEKLADGTQRENRTPPPPSPTSKGHGSG